MLVGAATRHSVRITDDTGNRYGQRRTPNRQHWDTFDLAARRLVDMRQHVDRRSEADRAVELSARNSAILTVRAE